MAVAIDGDPGNPPIASEGTPGNGSGLPGKSDDYDSGKQTGPRGPEVRTPEEWLTNRTHRLARPAASRGPRRARLC